MVTGEIPKLEMLEVNIARAPYATHLEMLEVNIASAPYATHSFSQGHRLVKLAVSSVKAYQSGAFEVKCMAPPDVSLQDINNWPSILLQEHFQINYIGNKKHDVENGCKSFNETEAFSCEGLLSCLPCTMSRAGFWELKSFEASVSYRPRCSPSNKICRKAAKIQRLTIGKEEVKPIVFHVSYLS
ncbi:aldehyde oxidase GLOX [Artemisia annua]|uniref:Aldehyde oxidase GLOX n=1 Tax=Artemisia annua TaxID=35608 RepID=A0A2U1QK24_ARTAN|nr:aldehyde oxidase GLOX [Artemisia annua]